MTYDNLWKTLKKQKISKRQFVKLCGWTGNGMLDNLNHNRPITTTTIEDICRALSITPNDILTIEPEEK